MLVCSCGNKTFTEEHVYAYKNGKDDKGEYIGRYHVGIKLHCTRCGKPKDIDSKTRLENIDKL
jgi:hypothetical protein